MHQKSASDIVSQLESVSSSPDFIVHASDLLEGWNSENGFGARAVIEGVLGFMESHPDLDFGSPGPLVHRLEQVSLEMYVPLLLSSLERFPTAHTLWMLNRVINGVHEGSWRSGLIEAMRAIAQRTDIASEVRDEAVSFLEHQGTR